MIMKAESRGFVLVVDDEKIALRNLKHILKKAGYTVRGTQSGRNALKLIDKYDFDVVLTDLKMPHVDGFAVLGHVKGIRPDTEVIMITGYATIDSAIESMKAGAFHYIPKPFKIDEVRKTVERAMEKRRLVLENREVKEKLERISGINLIAEDPAMKAVLELARRVATSDCSVLITGESGTGKEVVARYIHAMSPRGERSMVAVNCGVFQEELLANELFGHEKGAFTGADAPKKGLIEEADGSTLFLDEVTEITPSMQVKLLRILQEREFRRIGANRSRKVDVRFLFATNRNIEQMVEEGAFRQDLYFRINVVKIQIPPLSQRKRDIPVLVHYFMSKYSEKSGKDVRFITPEAMEMLKHYSYPGNVRELENIIERAVILTRDNTIGLENLPEMGVSIFRPQQNALPSLEEQEKNYIRWVLQQTDWNKTRAAEILEIDRVSLWRKIKRYGLAREEDNR